MNTPTATNIVKEKTLIPTDTVSKVSGVEQSTSQQIKMVQLDHLFPEKFGQYRVLKLLGKGGMGSVFLAEDLVLHRKVAIKTLRAELAMHEISKERFLREARIVSGIKHEHIVTVYNVGEECGIPYLAMEYLDGYSLEDIIQKKKRLNWPQIIRLGREIARALAVAHEHKLIHRDIKPGNIWLEAVDRKTSKMRVKILDFGLARSTEQVGGPTQAGMVVGTPHYVSPEQARGKELDPRSDLFSLGVVLYRLTTKTYPFDGADTLSLLTSLALDTPKPLREHNPLIPAAFDELVIQLLEKRPENRPDSAKIVADELQKIYNQVVGESEDPSNSGRMPARASSNPFPEPVQPAPEPVQEPEQETEPVYQASSTKLIVLLCGLVVILSLAVIGLIFYKSSGN